MTPSANSKLQFPSCSLTNHAEEAQAGLSRRRGRVRAALPATVENVQILTDDESGRGYHKREKQQLSSSQRRRQCLVDRWITDLRVPLCLLLRGYRLRPARQGVRKCRPMLSIGSQACYTSCCCPQLQAGLVIPIGGNVAESRSQIKGWDGIRRPPGLEKSADGTHSAT